MCLTGVVKRTNYSTKLLHPWKQFSVAGHLIIAICKAISKSNKAC
uniref:Uncharacterized protein n=1 Tax=Anguilla anguilla TaxID=7936 RepID=A0A0E9SGB4_ANGAN